MDLLGGSRVLSCPLSAYTILIAHSVQPPSTSAAANVVAYVLLKWCLDLKGTLTRIQPSPATEAEEDAHLLTMRSLLQFAINCRLLQSGAWIHYGERMQTLLDARVLGKPQNRQRTHINAPGVSLILPSIRPASLSKSGRQAYTFSMKLLPVAARVFPLLADPDTVNIGDTVYCLPRVVAPASFLGLAAARQNSVFNGPEDFNRFWCAALGSNFSSVAQRLLQHGYVLPPEATSRIVAVDATLLTLTAGQCRLARLCLTIPLVGYKTSRLFPNQTSSSRQAAVGGRSLLSCRPGVADDVRRIVAAKVFRSCETLTLLDEAVIRLVSVRGSVRLSAACLARASELLQGKSQESAVDGHKEESQTTAGRSPCLAVEPPQPDHADPFRVLNMTAGRRRSAPVVLPVSPPRRCLVRLGATHEEETGVREEGSEHIESGWISCGWSERGQRKTAPAGEDDSQPETKRTRRQRVLPPLATYVQPIQCIDLRFPCKRLKTLLIEQKSRRVCTVQQAATLAPDAALYPPPTSFPYVLSLLVHLLLSGTGLRIRYPETTALRLRLSCQQ
ncbi:hypothetical protein CSUI_008344 [Cystoisospora suis]|uniref:Uncharacterized protein n=1 Tax=Cystoisospora suis TaxID=483139 RepID=A0A2C6KMW0_9APIC|nr:hypothetical protein CSUI_008344 [Cystoisospora suis]